MELYDIVTGTKESDIIYSITNSKAIMLVVADYGDRFEALIIDNKRYPESIGSHFTAEKKLFQKVGTDKLKLYKDVIKRLYFMTSYSVDFIEKYNLPLITKMPFSSIKKIIKDNYINETDIIKELELSMPPEYIIYKNNDIRFYKKYAEIINE